MFHVYHREIVWEVPWEEADELERPMHRKMRVTAFVNATWEYFLNILLRSRSMDTGYFD
jgi:hypothetical protein